MTPYYQDDAVTLYHGDALEMMSNLPHCDAVITDPPYAATNLAWDTWPIGWPAIASRLTDNLWCFGSFRMFFDRKDDFAEWRLGQDIVWEKHNGSSASTDRFRRTHEQAVQFYRGDWGALYKQQQFTLDATAKQVRRKQKPGHWPTMAGPAVFTSEDGGPRQMNSVIYVRGCHGYAVNETQKPEGIMTPLLAYSVPPGGLVIDPFAGSGTTLVVARRDGRRAIGIEIRREQCDRIVERLAQSTLALGAS